jgi:hypothetical protein
MADEEDTLSENIVFNDGEALSSLKNLRDSVSDTREQVKGLSQEFQLLLVALGVMNNNLVQIADNTEKVTKAEGDAKEETSAFAGAMQQAGAALQMAFGLGVYQIVNNVINIIKGGVQDGLDFAQAMFLIESAVSQMRDAGVNVQFADLAGIVTDLGPKLQAFSNLDLSKIVGGVAALVGQFGATKDEVAGLTEFSAIAQMRLGTDAVANANLVSAALLNITQARSTQILKAMGTEISAQEVYNEAVLLGLDNGAKTYQQLDNNAKIQAGITLIMQQQANWQKWISEYQDTSVGQVKDLGAAWTNLWTGWGVAITNLMPTLVNMFDYVIGSLALISGVLESVIMSLKSGDWSSFADQARANFEQLYNLYTNPSLTAVKGSPTGPSLTPLNPNPDLGGGVNTSAADQLKIEQDAEKEIVSLHDSEAEALTKIQTDYQNKLLEDQTKYDRAMVAEDVDAANQRQKIEENAAETILVDAEKNRQSKIEAEQKYEEEMQNLTDSFQANLIDALRNNDAKTIVHLIEEYDNQKAEKIRQYNDENVIRDENYQQEIDLEKQKEAYDLQQLNNEVAQRKAALKVQFDNENKDAATQRDLQNKAEEVSVGDRLKAWADGLQVQYNLTADQMQNIYIVVNDYLGKNGYIDQVYTYIIARMAQVYAALGAGMTTPAAPSGARGHTGFAAGGSLFANTPTSVTFGEAGPEVAMFIPIGPGMSSVPAPASGGGNAGGSIQLHVTLDSNLEAKIVQTSLNNVALMIDRVQRQA